jgi:hypothetical protein
MQDVQQKIVTGLLVQQLRDGKLHHRHSLLACSLLVSSTQANIIFHPFSDMSGLQIHSNPQAGGTTVQWVG